MRLVDADALIKKAYDEAKGMAEPYDNFGVLVEWLVDKSPSIEPKRKTGQWIVVERFEDCVYAKCDKCKTVQVFYHGKQPTNFCPDCGAKMEEGEQDG